MDTNDTKPNQQPFASGPSVASGNGSGFIPNSEPSFSTNSAPTPPPTFTAAEPKKKGKKSLVAIIILVIVALAGVGFGIYGMTKPAEEVIVYKEIDVSTLVEDEEMIVTDSSHFYLGELGTKILIPDEYYGKISYLYRDNGTVLFWIYDGDTQPAYANPLSSSSYPIFALNTNPDAFSDEKYSYAEGDLVFTNQNEEDIYLHTTSFAQSADREALSKIASEVVPIFKDAYQYSNF